MKTDWEKYLEFEKEIGLLMPFDNWDLGLYWAEYWSSFSPRQVGRLQRYCDENRKYHIISYMDGYLLNRADPKALWLDLGNGNSDPSLIHLIAERNPVEEEAAQLKLKKLVGDQSFAEYCGLNGSEDIPTFTDLIELHKYYQK
jgi:hypothetical protein